MSIKHVGSLSGIVAVCLAVFFGPAIVAQNPARGNVHLEVGLMRSIFGDDDEQTIRARIEPLTELIRAQTGFDVDAQVIADPETMASRLQGGQIQIGFLHGVEYGWARKQGSKIQPLLLAVNQTTDLKAYLIVHANHAAKQITDLSGQRLAVPERNLHHTRIFLQRSMEQHGADVSRFFGERMVRKTAEDVLDDVVDRIADVTVVDGVAWQTFRERKPGRAARLRVLVESPAFPANAVVYYPGRLDEKVRSRVRESMLSVHREPKGQQMLNLGRLSGFVPVSADYEERVQAILKAFPEARASAGAIGPSEIKTK